MPSTRIFIAKVVYMVLGSSSRRSDSGVGSEGRQREKNKEERGKGREEGTPVRFVFKRSFGLFFRLVIRT